MILVLLVTRLVAAAPVLTHGNLLAVACWPNQRRKPLALLLADIVSLATRLVAVVHVLTPGYYSVTNVAC